MYYMYSLDTINNATLGYKDAIMRQAVHFSGKSYLNVTGLPEDFWRVSDWSIMALMKFGPGATNREVEVLGHGSIDNNKGFHVGVSSQVLNTRTSVLIFSPVYDYYYHYHIRCR